MTLLFRSVVRTAAAFLVLTGPVWAQTDTAGSTPAAGAADGALSAPAAWPRTFEKAGNTVLVYQPQINSWKDHATIRFIAAIAVTPAGTTQPQYGVIAAQGDTSIDDESRSVLITNLDLAVRFPGAPADKAAKLKPLVTECLPGLKRLDVPLDEVLACLHTASKARTADVSLKPPPIYYSDVPAILVIYMGQPQFRPITGAQLMFAVNTNWVVIMDTRADQYYLLDGDSWLTAPDPMAGPWTPAGSLPAGLSNLPEGGAWDDVRKHVPGVPLKTVPRVITSAVPAELIVTSGAPDYTPVPGTTLMYISNPVQPVFLDLVSDNYYFLSAGRWFTSEFLTGPWAAASTDLPAEFAKIPQDSPVGSVLASVPGTQEARDAVVLAQVPHKATISIADAKLNVTYDGTAKFVPIEGTPMKYAVNTPYQVVAADGQYYCCYDAVWFVAPAPLGPWAVCTSVPEVIYTIPPTCPLYNVTYVQVYGCTPTTVEVGYTGGYSGEYVAATGALMFGAGMLLGAAIANNNDYWYGCNPCYYSYGCAAHYSYGYGGYYRAGGAYYGPHGGAGWGAAYNPATGAWGRAGYAYGPAGAHWGAQAYNPFTNTYAAHAGGANGYQSWGHSYVQRGDNWAAAGHASGVRGSAGWAENAQGQWAAGAHSNALNSSVARTSNGNVYAGHDGNVYRNTGDGWQKYNGDGAWSDTSWNHPTSASQPMSSAATESDWRNGMQNRFQGGWNDNSWNDNNWRNNWENGGGFGDQAQSRWGASDTMNQLNRDAWSRGQGFANAESSWRSRSGGWGGGGRWGGGGWGGRSFGGGFGGRSFGGGFRR